MNVNGTQTAGEATLVLARLLESDNESHRCLAAQALGRAGTGAALQPLLERLWDEDEDVSHDSVQALGVLGDQRAVDVLCEYYDQVGLSDLKVAAVEALGRLGGAQAVDMLMRVAKSRDSTWEETELEDWDGYWDAQRKAVEALGQLGEERAVPVLVALLEDEEELELSAPVLQALSRMGERGRDALLHRLRKGSSIEKRRAAGLLGNHSTPEVQEALREGLRHPDGDVRAAMLGALGSQGESLPLELVSALARDKESEVRRLAVGPLGRISPDQAADLWFVLAKDREPEVRSAALEGLAGLKLRAALPFFRNGVDDPHQQVALSAIAGLEALADGESLPLLGGTMNQAGNTLAVRVRAVSALEVLGTPDARHQLQEGLACDASPVRLACLRALANLLGEDAPGFLEAALRGELVLAPEPDTPSDSPPEEENRAASLREPLETDHGSGEDSLESQAETQPPPRSTLEAIMRESASGESGDPDTSRANSNPADPLSEPQAEALLNEEEQAFLEETREGLVHNEKLLKPKPFPVHLDVQVLAARLMGEFGFKFAAQSLLKALGHDDDALRMEAATALGRVGDGEAVTALVPMLREKNWELRLAVTRSLGALGGVTASEALLGAWPDPHAIVRRELIRAVSSLASDVGGEAKVMFRDGLQDENPEVIKAAAGAALRGCGTERLPGSIREMIGRIIAGMERVPGHNWVGLGNGISEIVREEGCQALLGTLSDAHQRKIHPLAIGLLEELLHAG